MKRLVLVGAGYGHARFLWEQARRRLPDAEIVLVSPAAEVPYSGMIPGWLAGHYRWQECCIDFSGLCRRARAKFSENAAAGLDLERSEVVLESGARIAYDWLSLNIGSTVNPPSWDGIAVLPIRPLSRLRTLWEAVQKQIGQLAAIAEWHVAVVGGGAAGVECILALHRGLMRFAPHVRFHFTLVYAGREMLPGTSPGAARRLKRHLARRGIKVLSGFTVEGMRDGMLVYDGGKSLPADMVLWATGAEAFAWPGQAGILTDERGFIRVDSCLRSLSHRNVFAAGDCAAWEPPLPKAGVHAVRMGSVLAHNLAASLSGKSLRQYSRYSPPRRILSLIGTGDANAVAAWGSLSCEGGWVWRWKQFLDRRFVFQYNNPG